MQAKKFENHEFQTPELSGGLVTAVRTAMLTAMLVGCGTAKKTTTPVPPLDPLLMARFNSPEYIVEHMPERRLNIHRESLNEKGVLGVEVVNGQLKTKGYSDPELLALSMFIDTSSRAYFKPNDDGLLEVGVSPNAILEAYPMTCPPFRDKCATDAEYYDEIKETYEKKIYSMVSPIISVFEGAGTINYDVAAPHETQISLCINFSKYFDTEAGKLMMADMKQIPDQIRANIQEWEQTNFQHDNPMQARAYAQQIHSMRIDEMVEMLIEMVDDIPDDLKICRIIPYNREFEGYIDSFDKILILKIAIMKHIFSRQLR